VKVNDSFKIAIAIHKITNQRKPATISLIKKKSRIYGNNFKKQMKFLLDMGIAKFK